MERTKSVIERPFYFIVILWGERFRNYFLEFCLASLLAPGNIPVLATRARSKFLIATRPEDWAAVRETAIFRELAKYVEPVFVEIPPCPPNKSGSQHMGVGHKLCCEMAFQDKAYAVLLTPDCMLSDGSVARLQGLAQAGTEIVLAAALRFGEEPFFDNLRRMGLSIDERRRDTGRPLAVSGREMASAAINGLHPETLSYEWNNPNLAIVAPAAWWRVPGEDGIVLHSLSWAPLLVDYAAIEQHDTSTFDEWTLDGDYLFNNLATTKSIYAVTDSDESFIASWGPMAALPSVAEPAWFGEIGNGARFRRSFYSYIFDPLRRQLFFLSVRWHARPLGDAWAAAEKKALNDLCTFVRPDRIFTSIRSADGLFTQSQSPILSSGSTKVATKAMICVACVAIWFQIKTYSLRRMWSRRRVFSHRIMLALRGDPKARAWLKWRVEVLWIQIVKLRINITNTGAPPMPPLPED